jgi:hypothetical protein
MDEHAASDRSVSEPLLPKTVGRVGLWCIQSRHLLLRSESDDNKFEGKQNVWRTKSKKTASMLKQLLWELP